MVTQLAVDFKRIFACLLTVVFTGCALATLNNPTSQLRAEQEIITLNPRPSVTTRLLEAPPKTAPKGTVIVFMGGSGPKKEDISTFLRPFLSAARFERL